MPGRGFKNFFAFAKNSARTAAKGLNQKNLQSTIATGMSRGKATAKDVFNRLGDTGTRISGLSRGIFNRGGRNISHVGGTNPKYLKNVIQQSPVNSMMSRSFQSAAVVGGVGMMGLAFMKGGMNQSHDIMIQRYMQDSRMTSRLLTQTNLGSASGNSTLSIGNHAGVSLALHKNRHGY